ncbi:AraC family transcriptional regulator [Pseudoclavibacter sp. VKM Ac-2888]|uniref:AraC family transcriptional regulator n=1 Tax=Pseudoclavibacter sp. VKM Ac-2888 TaxID=2783830 RepID=UPI00188A4C30|nr:AraC family transcriptional regulator [Pseudoclavibacter sp. VKM Ac-2888]MBF4550080.1 helix-turn-helix transcriptional regulator [Pseudoclavibacter sp. VKM Ac-2888]
MDTYDQRGARGVSLAGDAALAWFARGQCDAFPQTLPLRLHADYSHVHGFLITRIWHTPVRLDLVADPVPDDRLTVIVPVSGVRVLTTQKGRFEIAPGQVVLSRRRQMLSLETSAPSSMITLATDAARLPGLRGIDALMDTTLTADSGLVSVLVSAVNATLRAPQETESNAFAPWRRSLEYMLTAVIDSTLDERSNPLDQPTTSILERALRAIDDRAHDPAFGVAALCEVLHVSSTSLHRAFKNVEMSPGVYLRNVRTGLAVDVLTRQGSPITESMLRMVAPGVGFGTSRSLRRALQANEEGRRLISGTGQHCEDGKEALEVHPGSS